MILSEEDMQKIQNLGYRTDFFCKKKKGWKKLKNRDGRCVFHNGKICSIYDNRPEGCMLYPLIFNKDSNSAVVDEDCPYADGFQFNKRDIEHLYNLVTQIMFERKIRKK